jgi:hypothetical protein
LGLWNYEVNLRPIDFAIYSKLVVVNFFQRKDLTKFDAIIVRIIKLSFL